MCSTNDPGTDLFPSARQLLDITLSHRLDGGPVTGRPEYVGTLATGFPCGTVTRTGEVEGIDVARDVLRVVVRSPCSSESMLMTMSDSRAARTDPDPHLKWRVAAAQSPMVLQASGSSSATRGFRYGSASPAGTAPRRAASSSRVGPRRDGEQFLDALGVVGQRVEDERQRRGEPHAGLPADLGAQDALGRLSAAAVSVRAASSPKTV